MSKKKPTVKELQEEIKYLRANIEEKQRVIRYRDEQMDSLRRQHKDELDRERKKREELKDDFIALTKRCILWYR